MRPTSYRIDTAVQGSPEWLAARVGYLTGSRAGDIVARRKDGQPAAAYYDYLAQMIAERLTGMPQDTGIVTPWMQRGTELEPAARNVLEQSLDEPIFECGFIAWERRQMGCSIDGYMGESREGIVELKCPKPTTHLRYLQGETVPVEYQPQVMHNMLITGARRAVFASYCPQMPEHLRLVVRKVTADEWEEAIAKYWAALRQFDDVVNEQVLYWRDYGTGKERYRGTVGENQ